MQFLAVLNIFFVKTYLNYMYIFTNDLKRKDFFWKNVPSYRPSLFNINGVKICVVSKQHHLQNMRTHVYTTYVKLVKSSK